MNLYTTGQAAYHGTKLVGGSEEDAQTANFLRNLIEEVMLPPQQPASLVSIR